MATMTEVKTPLQRTKCEIYTRVMWYYRPVTNFNIGKKSEFYSRTYFNEDKSLNSRFINCYSWGQC